MSKKKGLSLDEKRQRMMDFFLETKEVYQLKELEKLLPKEKGISFQSIKEILKSLEDDEMVDSDKISLSTYYWAFPSKRATARNNELSSLEVRINELKERIKIVEKDLEKNKTTDEQELILRQEANARLSTLMIKRDELKKQLHQYKDNDPFVLQEMKKEIKDLKDATNIWTDNIFALRDFCRDKFNLEEAQFNERFEISDDLDYISL